MTVPRTDNSVGAGMAVDMIRARRRAENLAQAASFLCQRFLEVGEDEARKIDIFASFITRNFATLVEVEGGVHNVNMSEAERVNSTGNQPICVRTWVFQQESLDTLSVRIWAPRAFLVGEGGRSSVTLDLLVNVLALAVGRTCETQWELREASSQAPTPTPRGDDKLGVD